MKISYDTKKINVTQRVYKQANQSPESAYSTLNYVDENNISGEIRLMKPLTGIVAGTEVNVAYVKDDIIAYRIENEDKIHWIDEVSINFKENNFIKVSKFIIILFAFIPIVSILALLLAMIESSKYQEKNMNNISVNVIKKGLRDYSYAIPIVISYLLQLIAIPAGALASQSNFIIWISLYLLTSLLFTVMFYRQNKEYYTTYGKLKIEVEEKLKEKP